MKNEVQLGTQPAEDAKRDAVHVAVLPIIAGQNLLPGDRVRIENGQAFAALSGSVGVVDPFLIKEVAKGDRFYLCLHPGNVTGMRHCWSSRHVEDEEPVFIEGTSKEESEEWIKNWLAGTDVPDYDTVIAAAVGEEIPEIRGYREYGYNEPYVVRPEVGCIVFIGRDAHQDIPPEFWDHVENVTGKKVPYRAERFSCSC